MKSEEIEKKYLVDARLLELQTLMDAGLLVSDMVQGYLPVTDGLALEEDGLRINENLFIPAPKEKLGDIREKMLDENGRFPMRDVELRVRSIRTPGGRGESLFTIKGPAIAGGSQRHEVEFDIPESALTAAQKFARGFIVKKRAFMPIAFGNFEIDFYTSPKLPFASIEMEFDSQEDLAAFGMPAYIARLHLIDATDFPELKNKNLCVNPAAAIAVWEKAKTRDFEHLIEFPNNTPDEDKSLYRHWADVDWFKKTERWKDLEKRIPGSYKESDPEHSLLLAMCEYFGSVWNGEITPDQLLRRIEYANDHDLPEFVTEDITYEYIEKQTPEKKKAIQERKAYAEQVASRVLLASMPEKARRHKRKLWDDYEALADDGAKSVKGNDKIVTLIGAAFREFEEKHMAGPRPYVNKALSLVPQPNYWTTTMIERLPGFMRPDELASKIAERDAALSPEAINGMRAVVGFLNEIFRGQDEKRFAQRAGVRKESMLDHTWQLCYMLTTWARTCRMPDGFEILRALKMALTHDLAEVKLIDFSHEDVFNGLITKAYKHKMEEQGLRKLTKKLPAALRDEIMSLWLEYEETVSPTAVIVRAMDKIEATIHTMNDALPYDPNVRGLHGNEYYAKAPQLWPFVRILKHQLKLDYQQRGHEWKPEFDNWMGLPPSLLANAAAMRAERKK
ncbi:MAG: HD domain-containing protein [Rickettsiales bacterium]|nr:HD domain-containing protein [Rickettsiales bacterium]